MFETLAAIWPLTPFHWVILGIVFVGLIIGIVRGAKNVERDVARVTKMWESIADMGLVVDSHSSEFDPEDFAFLLGNPLLRYTNNSVRWFAVGEIAGRTVRVVEYYYNAFGRDERLNSTLIVAVDLPLEGANFTIERKRWMQYHRLGRPQSDQIAVMFELSRKFDFYAGSDEGARQVLVPAVQQRLQGWSKAKWLRLHDGVLLIGHRGLADAVIARSLIDEAMLFADAVEAEQSH